MIRACGCGHHFPDALGAYGCPNCEGERGPALLTEHGEDLHGVGYAVGSLGSRARPRVCPRCLDPITSDDWQDCRPQVESDEWRHLALCCLGTILVTACVLGVIAYRMAGGGA